MIQTVAIAFVVFVLAVIGMGVGAMVTGRRLKGSCGGLSTIEGVDRCHVCGRDVSGETDVGSAACIEPPAGDRARW